MMHASRWEHSAPPPAGKQIGYGKPKFTAHWREIPPDLEGPGAGKGAKTHARNRFVASLREP